MEPEYVRLTPKEFSQVIKLPINPVLDISMADLLNMKCFVREFLVV